MISANETLGSAFMQQAYENNAHYQYDVGPYGGHDDWGSLGNIASWWKNLGGGLDYQRTYNLAEFDRQFNSEEALKSRQWNEYMAGNSYQLAVDDMRKAGLNPYMALGNGGASYSSSAPASSRTGSFSSGSNPASVIGSLLSHLVGGAFGLAKASMNNQRLEELAELRNSNAYDMQTRRFENQRERDFLKHEFNMAYKDMDYNRATAPKESHVWHYDGNRRR